MNLFISARALYTITNCVSITQLELILRKEGEYHKMKEIGKRIAQYREAKGYTQEKFAEIVALTPNYLSAVERGVKTPSVKTLVAIINSLEVSADEIFIDVIKVGYKIQASKFANELSSLSQEDQKRIFTVIGAMIREAKSK